jgi:hypothetical protein
VRFHFDSSNGERVIIDDEGLEFSTTSLMRAAAIAASVDMARDEFPDGDQRQFSIRVGDEQGVYGLASEKW